MSRFAFRRDKIRKQFKKLSVDAFLITNPINVRYLTGFTGNDSFVILKKGTRAETGDTLLSDGRFTIQIEEECPGLETYIRTSKETMTAAVASVLGKKTSGKLGVEADTMTLAERDKFSQQLPSWQPVPVSGIIEEQRQIKDRVEIDLIRQAIGAAHRAFNDIRKILKPEHTEIDLRNDLEFLMRLHGAEEKSFPSIIGAGPRAALPHGVPGWTKVTGHSHLLIDWGAIVNGYMSDLTRVLIFSPKDKKLRKIYDTVLKAQQAAIDAVKPGKTSGDIDAVARAVITDAGYGKYFHHGLGHSFGLEIHEAPRFAMGHQTVLKPGMVMTVEPGIYLKDWGGIRIEDDILITKNGCDVLSKSVPKSFDEMVVDNI